MKFKSVYCELKRKAVSRADLVLSISEIPLRRARTTNPSTYLTSTGGRL